MATMASDKRPTTIRAGVRARPKTVVWWAALGVVEAVVVIGHVLGVVTS